MREGTFHEELPVRLTEDERNIRARQAARLEVALQKHLVDAKEAKKKLADREKELEEGIRLAAIAAEIGEEKRQVECRDVMRGVMVETVRQDTLETVEARPATREELGAGVPSPAPAKAASKAASKKKRLADEDPVVDDDYRPSH